MKVGVTFPQSDLYMDSSAVRHWARTVEELGFDHILLYDHIIGADVTARPQWTGFHTSKDRFHEILVTLGYLAAITEKVELVTGILCLPQRQTVLVAKQAAEVDILSNGRLRLGVGIGWNEVEYEALGMSFEDRPSRMEEQIILLRKLWSEEHIKISSKWHTISDAGLNPLPIQRPIPIWYGSTMDKTIDRAARLADGWMPGHRKPELVKPQIQLLHDSLIRHGRDISKYGLHGRFSLKDGAPDDWKTVRDFWDQAGASHFSISTIYSGELTLDGHLSLIEKYATEIGLT